MYSVHRTYYHCYLNIDSKTKNVYRHRTEGKAARQTAETDIRDSGKKSGDDGYTDTLYENTVKQWQDMYVL